MSQFYLKIDLKEPVVFSESAASLGRHRSLDYIPGAALLGVAASKLYSCLGANAFSVFHSGKVRFANAYPLSANNAICYPIPFAWFYAKGDDYKESENKLKADAIFNLMHCEKQALPDNKQPKQLRAGYISNQLDQVQAKRSLRMKTAIDPTTARAATSQLFGYQSLEAGQSFIASIRVDDDLGHDIQKQIEASLQGTLFLGRSRSAQYGRVEASIVTIEGIQDLSCASDKDNKTILWLHSDLALKCQDGLPVTASTLATTLAKALGLSKTVEELIDWNKSSLRFRHYSPYNAYRNAYDMQRQVIEKGSVIYLNVASDQCKETHKTIGLYQSQGLGQIEINHPLLAGKHPATELPVVGINATQADHQDAEKPKGDLLAEWLDGKQKQQTTNRDERRYAEKTGAELAGLYQNARSFAGVEPHISIGPSATQWGLISDAGKQHQAGDDRLHNSLKAIVFNRCKENERGCQQGFKDTDDKWSIATFTEDQQETTFSNWLLDKLNKKSGRVASLVARIAQDHLKQQKLRSKE